MQNGFRLQITKEFYELINIDSIEIESFKGFIDLYKKNKYRFLLLSFKNKLLEINQTVSFLYTFLNFTFRKISSEQEGYIPLLNPEEMRYILSFHDFVKGGLCIDEEWVNKNFKKLVNEVYSFAKDMNYSISKALIEFNPDLAIPSKMYFHLVENTNAHGKPFAFMVTFTSSDENNAKHYPVRSILESHFKNSQQLVAINKIIKSLESDSAFMRTLITSGDFFKPLLIDEKAAYTILKETGLYEDLGVICRTPKWHAGTSRIEIDIDEKKYYQPIVFVYERLISNSPKMFYRGVEITYEEALEILSKSEGLEKIKGKWIEINHEEIASLIQEYEDLQSQGITIKDLLNKNNGIHVDGISRTPVVVTNSNWISNLNPLMFAKKTSAEIPENLLHILRPYQRDAFYWLTSMKSMNLGACLADDMGLGKTLEVISFLSYLYNNQKGPILIIVPATLVNNWINEIQKFAPYMDYYVLCNSYPPQYGTAEAFITITTYQSAAKSEYLRTIDWEEIILDEAQAIKNYYTVQTKAIKLLKGKHKIALTGTPMENNVLELWSLFDFLNPGYLGTKKEFIDFVAGKQMVLINPDKLKKLINPFILRRMKTDKNIIRDLPEKHEICIKINLAPRQIVLYNDELKKYKDNFDNAKDKRTKNELTLLVLNKLKQICNHPSQYLGDSEYKIEESGKFMELKSLCETIAAKQEKVIVFTQYKEIIPALNNLLYQVFGKKGEHIDGDVRISKRTCIIESFQKGEYPYLVMSLKTGGVGITLTEACNVIHFDRWWNPAVENQATDRTYRIGQDKNVFVYKFTSTGTIEDLIDTSILIKTGLTDSIINSLNYNKTISFTGEELFEMLKYRGIDYD